MTVAFIAALAAGYTAWQNARTQEFYRLFTTLQQFVVEDQFFSAYQVARELKSISPKHPGLMDVWSEITHDHTLVTTPRSAQIFVQDYFKPESPWISLGRTPFASIDLPYGVNRFKVWADGYLPLEVAILNRKGLSNLGSAEEDAKQRHINWVFHPSEHIPSDMVWIPGVKLSQQYMFHSRREIANDEAFLIDKYEVTNRAFKAFVDARGYDNRQYWQEPFVREGVTVSWEHAIRAACSILPAPVSQTRRRRKISCRNRSRRCWVWWESRGRALTTWRATCTQSSVTRFVPCTARVGIALSVSFRMPIVDLNRRVPLTLQIICRPTCPKNSTLGKFVQEDLDPAWFDYIDFHLTTFGCHCCRASYKDLMSQGGWQDLSPLQDRILHSTLGFFTQVE